MRILLINKFYYPRGGDCIYTLELEKLLKSKKHDVAVFSMNHPKNNISKYQSYWPSQVDYSNQTAGKKIKSVSRPLYSGEVVKKFSKLLNQFQPDIVHANNIHTQISPIILQQAANRNIPVIWTLHDYKLICPSYTCLRNGTSCELCFKNKKHVIINKCIKNSFLASSLAYFEAKMWNTKKLEAITDIFISPSNFLKQKMILGGYSGKKIEVIHNFSSHNVQCNGTPVKQKYFCYVGRLSPEKGVQTLLKAFQNTPYSLKIVGDGILKQSLSKKYASKNIEFLGHKQRNEVFSIISRATALLLPSEWYENNPLSILEALMLGTPVIAANIGGIPELITENENGLLFQSGNIDHLKERVHYFSKELVAKINTKQIANDAMAKYNHKMHYNKLLAVYKRVISSKSNSH